MLLLLRVLPGYTQCMPQRLYCDTIEFRRNHEFSGLAFVGDELWLPAEKCNAFLVCSLNRDSGIHLQRIMKPGLPEGAAIEGVAKFGDHLLLADEGILPGNCRLWDYNHRTGKLRPLKHNSRELTACLSGEYGIEGIACNLRDSICYVVQERTDTLHSDLFIFRIHASGDSLYLEQQSIARLALPGLHWRYADIYFDEPSRSLLGLRTYYDVLHKERAEYILDRIPLDKEGLKPGTAITICSLTDFVRAEGQRVYAGAGTANNTEGLAIKDGWLYIVSDNKGSAGCTMEYGKWPLTFRMPLSNH
jgi:hypothetical protein